MLEQDTQHPVQRAAAFSWKVFALVMLLSILPPLLPFLFSRLDDQWIFPRAAAALQQCTDFVCQAATDWMRLE
jgi:hypothetical protein